jgi:hypothetical protein
VPFVEFYLAVSIGEEADAVVDGVEEASGIDLDGVAGNIGNRELNQFDQLFLQVVL